MPIPLESHWNNTFKQCTKTAGIYKKHLGLPLVGNPNQKPQQNMSFDVTQILLVRYVLLLAVQC